VKPQSRLVGRAEELATLRSMLNEVREQNTRRIAVVSGDVGVGKSRLIAEALRDLEGWSVLRAEARSTTWTAPFQTIRDALEPWLLERRELPDLLDRLRHPLFHLLTPHLDLPEHPDDGHVHPPAELVAAASTVIHHLASQGPMVLSVEDVHHADDESLEILLRVTQAAGGPVAVITSYRTTGPRAATFADWLAQVLRTESATLIELAALNVQHTGELIAQLSETAVPRSLVESLYDRTGGNPRFIEELAANAPPGPDGAVPLASLLDAPVSGALRDLVRARLDRLDEPRRQLVERAAVLGPGFPLELLGAVTDLDATELITVVREFVDDGILVEERPDQLAFRDALIRDVVASQLLHHDRRDVHGRALAALESSATAPPELLVHHAAGAGATRALLDHAERAASAATERGAHRTALRLAAAAGDQAATSRLLQMAIARSALVLGDFETAREATVRWERLAGDDHDPAGVAEAASHHASVLWSMGRRQDAWAALERGLPALDGTEPSRGHAWWEAVSGQLHLLEGRNSEALHHADRALELAEDLGDRRIAGHARVTRAVALLVEAPADPDEELEEAVNLLAQARRDAAERGDMELLGRAYHNSILPGMGLASLSRSRRLLSEARAISQQHGLVRFERKLETLDMYIATLEGDLDRAAKLLTEAPAGAASVDDTFLAARATLVLSELGRADEAERWIDPHRSHEVPTAVPEMVADVAEALSYLAASRGDAELGAEALVRMGTVARELPFGAALAWWDIAANALCAGTDPRLVERRLDSDAPPVNARTAPAAAHIRGRLAAADGRDEEAAALLADAAAEPHGCRPRAMLVDAVLTHALTLARVGEVELARQEAERALELLARWPGWRRHEVDRFRARVGSTGARSDGLLTPREMEVARLVAQGFTNGEIAERLFISPKTASAHVSNILRKTGLARRTQVADWAHRQGLV
jgi:DNA-binding CsgD family transcriptional regulator